MNSSFPSARSVDKQTLGANIDSNAMNTNIMLHANLLQQNSGVCAKNALHALEKEYESFTTLFDFTDSES